MTRASREFQVMAKPTGALCNLDCRYCYYLRTDTAAPAAPRRMDDTLLEAYIVQHIEATPGEVINFEWHGGEPTRLGVQYFQRIVERQRQHRPEDRRVTNGIQTNGTLLDEAWARFLAAEDFFVGLSLDGPAEVHDAYRVTKGERATHRDVVRAFRLLRAHRVRTDVLCVVHDRNVAMPRELYRYFTSDLGARHLQFLPLVEPVGDGGAVTSRTPSAEAWGEFLCAIFDEWVRRDVGRVTVQMFDEAARPACGLPHALCIFRETCGDVPVVEWNGDFYSCDHFVDAAHRVGNIQERALGDLVEDPRQRAFGLAKRDTLPAFCRACEVRELCNGGCPKDRILRAPDGEPGLNYLCAGFKRFFTQTRPAFERLATLWRAGQPVERLMEEIRSREATPPPVAGRNDPCPCGSGRKYKKCCLLR
jgi:uncharacterized protein